jgi:hypothetical protein
MDQAQDSTAPETRTLMDAVPREAYDEWREHPCTKLLLGQLKEDIETVKNEIVARSTSKLVPEPMALASLGHAYSARVALLQVATERSDG